MQSQRTTGGVTLDPFTGTIVSLILMFAAGASTAVSSAGFGLASSEEPFNTPAGQRQFLHDIGAGHLAHLIPG